MTQENIANNQIWERNWRTKSHWGGYPNEFLVRLVASFMRSWTSPHPPRVLELGCGSGSNLWFMAREKIEIYGIDGSESAIDLAQKRLDREAPAWQGKLSVGDISQIDYPNNTFDLVIDVEAICCNSREIAKAIHQEIYRVLKPSGQFFSVTFAEGCWGEGTGQQVGPNAWIPTEGPLATGSYTRFTDKNDIKDLLLPLSLKALNLTTRTVGGLDHTIREWIIEATKQEDANL